jgi:iron(III) transport system permease protein
VTGLPRATTSLGSRRVSGVGGVDWLPVAVALAGAAFFCVFLIYPIGKTALLAFVTPGATLAWQSLTLQNLAAMFTAPLYRAALLHTIVVALCATVISVAVALPAAYILARCTLPGRNALLTLCVVPLISPPFIGAFSWVVLLGNQGVVTRIVAMLTGLHLPGLYGPVGIVLALVLSFFPYVLLFVHAALMAADPTLEESARIMGASRLRVLLTVTFPLIMPAAAAGALLVFAQSVGNFGVPSILGREYSMMTTLLVYEIEGSFNINGAAAIALVNVLMTSAALVLLSRYARRNRFITITSTARAARRVSGGIAGVIGGAYVWGLLVLALLPELVVVFDSFAERWPGTLWPTRYGLANYRYVLSELIDPMMNSVVLAAAATALSVVVGALAAYAATRGKRHFGRGIDLMIMLPFVMPGLLTGVAFLVTFNSGWLVLSGTALIMVLAYVVHRLAYIFRAVCAAIGQVDTRIDEASTVCGARWLTTMRRVTLPLIAPGIVAGGVLVFSTLIMDLSITILLYSPEWKTLAIVMFDQLSNNKIGYASASGSLAILVATTLVFLASRLAGRSMAEMFR